MTFAWPYLLGLLAAPIALLGWELARRRRADSSAHPKILRAEAGARTLELAPAARAEARRRATGWLVAGLILAIIAVARPQWGRIDEPVYERSREILIALDLSKSMLTADVKPSRLERAKLLVQSLLDRLEGERVGLVVFSGTAFLQSPLSADYDILREFLPSLGPDTMPVGGTNYGALLDASAGAFDSVSAPGVAADRYLVVLSDGGATDEDWQGHLGRLKKLGVRVISLGIGTGTGALIPDGPGQYLKDDQGAVVMSRLESAVLQQMAEKTGGAYRDASQWIDLPAVLRATVEAGRRGQFVEKNQVRYVERFQWFLAPALMCLLASFWREFPVRPKPREVRLAPRKAVPGSAGFSPHRAALCGLKPALPGLLLVFVAAAFGAADSSPAPDAPLARIVGRLAGQPACTSRDWAEMARETVSWGQQIQSSGQAVPAGPVNDALAAVDAGSAADPALTSWASLRSQLEALRAQPEQKKPDQQQPKPQEKQQNRQQQGQQQKQQQQQQGQSSPSSGSNFGNMAPQPQAPPPPESGTQPVGGAEHKRPDAAGADPSLAAPLQKLEQIRNQDSPAQLFQMLENNEPRPPDTKGKNW